MKRVRSLIKSNTLLFLITLLAFFLRINKINHHLDGGLFFEEPRYLQLILTNFKDFPCPFIYPPLYNFLISIINKVYFLCGVLGGHFHLFADLIHNFSTNYSIDFFRLLLVHRTIVAIIGTATVPVLYLTAKTLVNKLTGIIAALFLAINPLHVALSFEVRPDIMHSFLICVAFLYIAKIIKNDPLKKYYLFAGFFIGLATATKYFGLLCIIPFAIAHFFNGKRDKIKDGYFHLGLATTVLTFVVTCIIPILLDLKGFNNTLSYYYNHFTQPGPIYEATAQKIGWIGYPLSLISALGIGIFFLSVIKILIATIKHELADITIIFFLLVNYISIGNFYHPEIRYILPIIPFMILMAAMALSPILQKLKSLNNLRLLSFSIVCCFALPSLYQTIYFMHWISQKDIKPHIKKWISNNIPKNSHILFDTSVGSPAPEPILLYSKKNPYTIALIDWKNDLEPHSFFTKKKFDYVIIDSGRIVPTRLRPFYEYIDNHFMLIKELKPAIAMPKYSFSTIYNAFYNCEAKIYKVL